mmetsp:Transcript_11779/g.25072  ORF Transcript_11779/g.25072 Transcript_11779/m.25072 type:complete len:1591 (-) Transcript_11779:61-4833(-)
MSTVIVDPSCRSAHHRGGPPTTAAAAPTTSENANSSGKILQKRWVCDVCKVKWFLDFKEACAHEAQCKGRPPSSSNAPSSSSNATANVNVVRENSLICEDSNDGSLSSNKRRGSSRSSCKSSSSNSDSSNKSAPSSEKVASIIAAARAKVAKERNKAKMSDDASGAAVQLQQQQQRGDGTNATHSAADIIMDSSDGEEEGDDNAKANVTNNKMDAKKPEAKDTAEMGVATSKHVETASSAPSNDIPATASTSTSTVTTSSRRTSKRLRDAASKPPPLQESFASHNTTNKANGKKAKKTKTTKDTKQSSKSSAKTASSKASTKKKGQPLASIFLSKKAASKSTETSSKSKRKGSVEVTAVIPSGVSRKEYEEHVAAEKMAEQRKKKRAASADDTHATGKKKTARTRSKRSKRSKRAVDIESSSSDDDSDNDGDSSSDEEFVTKKTKGKKASKNNNNFLAGKKANKQQLAEHQAADFFAKRKKAAAEERERQKKREEARLIRLQNGGKVGGEKRMLSSGSGSGSGSGDGVVSGTVAEKPTTSSSDGPFGLGKKNKGVPAVRFPCPSHVVTEDYAERDGVAKCSSSLQVLRMTPKHPHLKVDMSPCIALDGVDGSDDSTFSANFLRDSDPMSSSLERNTMFDLLSSVYASQAKLIEERDTSSSNDDHTDNHQLWSDKYSMSAIPDDVLGETNKASSEKLITFIEEWKIRRHKAVQVMGLTKSTKKKKKRRKSHGYDSDDSFLDDGGLENLFLVTGPTGAGKTRLVHAAADQLECAVIELNSSEARSGMALKRAIQETTLSHSSLAMSKKKKASKKKKHVNLFGKNVEEEQVDDENDEDDREEEDDSDESLCYDSESDDEPVKESHSLTVILIDEVDLLFDEDTAFWPALAQVSEKAKCPIVLTASSVPRELSSFKCQHISLDRPSPKECGIKMARVSQSEGMVFREDLDLEEKSKRLSLIAEACQCDIRKILNEMHLFSRSNVGSSRDVVDMDNFGLKPNSVDSSNPSKSVILEDRPTILSVEPKLVPKDRHTLITIIGKNFSNAVFPSQQSQSVKPTNLIIGGQQCRHFHVVDDSKIVAVCPPCVLPEGVLGDAIYEYKKGIDCLSCKVSEVVVRKTCSNGLVLDSSSRIGFDIKDHTSESLCWNIEYDFPLRDDKFEQKNITREEFIRKSKELKLARENMNEGEGDGLMSSSEEEFEEKQAATSLVNGDQDKDKEENTATLEEVPLETQPEVEDVDPQVILKEAISEMTECIDGPSTKAVLSPEDHSIHLLEINRFADELDRLSDVVLFEDSLTTLGIPSLSGPVEGFGSHAMDSTSSMDPSIDKLCKGKNKKPPSLETLYATGTNESDFFFGNSDSFVTHPIRSRDRQVLSYSCLHSRGLGLLDNNVLYEENPDNTDGGLEKEDTDAASCFDQLQTRVRSEDDILLNPLVSPTLLQLPSMLEQTLNIASKHGFTRHQTPLLQSRRTQIATNSLGIMHSAVANCNMWYVGLRHDEDHEAIQKNHVWLGDSVLDHPLSLDYVPHLRAIAQYEKIVRQQIKDMMKENREAGRGGRRTRASRKRIRRHYLEEVADGKDKYIEDKLLELANNYMG